MSSRVDPAGRNRRHVATRAPAGPGSSAEWPQDALEVGRIIGAWGIKGWLKVQPFSAEADALLAAPHWYVKPPEDAVPRPALPNAPVFPEVLAITDVREHGGAIVAFAEGVADRTAAESLRGARLFVSRAEFPAAGEDEYYWADLIGLEVRNRQGEHLGTVSGLLETGPQSVLRVKRQGAEGEGPAPADELLIPFVSAYVDDVDLERRLVSVDWGPDF